MLHYTTTPLHQLPMATMCHTCIEPRWHCSKRTGLTAPPLPVSARSPEALNAAPPRLVHDERRRHRNVVAVDKTHHWHRGDDVGQRHRLGAHGEAGQGGVGGQPAGCRRAVAIGSRERSAGTPSPPPTPHTHAAKHSVHSARTPLLVAHHKGGGLCPVDLADVHGVVAESSGSSITRESGRGAGKWVARQAGWGSSGWPMGCRCCRPDHACAPAAPHTHARSAGEAAAAAGT